MVVSHSDSEIAPCLVEGPICEQARKAVRASRNLGATRWASLARAWSVAYLFDQMERAFASDEEPVAALCGAINNLTEFLSVAEKSGFAALGGFAGRFAEGGFSVPRPVEEVTGEHYGRLFIDFSSASFWDEPLRLLTVRLERNGLAPSSFESKEVLDAGCGGGRYAVAWRLLGARRVVGLDVSEIGIKSARERVLQGGITGVEFKEGDVLELPFPRDSFDIVFSNGVLHHTVDPARGVAEAVRVLRPGGLGWLYLIEKPGGLFWDVIEILRVIVKNESRNAAKEALQMLGIPANRIFYMLDHVMVPINTRLTPDEVEGYLLAAGATDILRLSRGADFDRIEQIHQGAPFARLKYGVGENRFVFSKAN